jgi:hypothetical protein
MKEKHTKMKLGLTDLIIMLPFDILPDRFSIDTNGGHKIASRHLYHPPYPSY